MKDFHKNAISTQEKIQLDGADQNLIFCDDDTGIRLKKINNCAVIKSGKSWPVTEKW